GSYSGVTENTSITVRGPIEETATFATTPAHAVHGTSSPSFFGSPPGWAVLAIVGVIIGILLGALLARRRGGATPDRGDPAPPQEPGPGVSP
ncbi:MAG: hypothetical protein ACREC5_02880, partial [Thermoplasmata archaeon]